MKKDFKKITSISGYGFTKPNSSSKSIIKWYDNKEKALVVTKEFLSNKSISYCTRLSKMEYFDKRLNSVRKYNKKHKRCKERTTAFGRLGFGNRLILCNFEGNSSEILIKLHFSKKIKDSKQVTKLSNKFLNQLKKKITPIIYIKVWIYRGLHSPECHLWLKTIDNSKLEIPQSLLEELWKENGTVEQQEITKENREKLANYLSDNYRSSTRFYPHLLHIITYSRNYIKFEENEPIIYEQLNDKLKGFEKQFQSTKRIFINEVSGQREIVRVSYETYYKNK